MLISEDGTQFAFLARELAVLTSVMAKPEPRSTWAALWLYPVKAQAWATDGHRAVMVERADTPPKVDPTARSVAIPAATAAHVARTAGPRDWIVVDIRGEAVAIDIREPKGRDATADRLDEIEAKTRSRHAVTCTRHPGDLDSIDSFFPSARGRKNKGDGVTLYPAYLKSAAILGKVADPDPEVFVSLGGPVDPVLFVASAGPSTTWRMLIMPRRPKTNGPPEHAGTTPPAKAPKEKSPPATLRAVS